MTIVATRKLLQWIAKQSNYQEMGYSAEAIVGFYEIENGPLFPNTTNSTFIIYLSKQISFTPHAAYGVSQIDVGKIRVKVANALLPSLSNCTRNIICKTFSHEWGVYYATAKLTKLQENDGTKEQSVHEFDDSHLLLEEIANDSTPITMPTIHVPKPKPTEPKTKRPKIQKKHPDSSTANIPLKELQFVADVLVRLKSI